jgi:voltage-gated potassium channel Kch
MFRQFRFLTLFLLLSLASTATLLYFYEHGVNPQVETFGDAAWWWLVTSATVGYGDIYPITTGGRIAGVGAILVGIYCYTNFVTLTAASLNDYANRERSGSSTFKGKDHIIICEYTAFADEMIQVLDQYPELASRPAVLVTDLVTVQPYPQIHFIRGVPISPSTLKQAGIDRAAYVFVFANIRFVDPDLKTLHCVHRIRKLAPNARIFMELNEPEHELAWHLGDEITVLKSRDMLKSILAGNGIDLSAYFPKRPNPSDTDPPAPAASLA